MRIVLAAVLAAFLAGPVAYAADRPVGPETGQARLAEDSDRDFGQGSEQDWGSPFVDSWDNFGPAETNLSVAGWFRALARMFTCGIRGINTPC